MPLSIVSTQPKALQIYVEICILNFFSKLYFVMGNIVLHNTKIVGYLCRPHHQNLLEMDEHNLHPRHNSIGNIYSNNIHFAEVQV